MRHNLSPLPTAAYTVVLHVAILLLLSTQLQLHEVVHRSVDPSRAVLRGRRADEQSGRMDTAACTALLQLVARAMDRLFPVASPSSRALQQGASGRSHLCR
jgi:hypothetical protein